MHIRLSLIALIFVCASQYINASEKDYLIMESRFPYFHDSVRDMPYESILNEIKRQKDDLFEWEKPFYDLFYTSTDYQGATFKGFVWLYDVDVFFGRGVFPEARMNPLLEGNNYNRTFNNEMLRSDDFILREGVVRGRMDIDVVRTTERGILRASAYITSGENFAPENSSLYFRHISYDYSDTWHFKIGEVNPYFDDFTLNKRQTPLPGFEMSTKVMGADFYFVAARPDFPLDFAHPSAEEIVLYAQNWDNEDVIHHFDKPYNVFEIVIPPVRVYRYTIVGGILQIEDITELCTINHAEVIIPKSVLNPETQKIVINADSQSRSSRQTMYLNAFQLYKKWEYTHGSLSAACSYVDLHNDTHSVENIQGLVGPMDSNIWSMRIEGIHKSVRLAGQFATSKFTPDDNKFNVREVDSLYVVRASYATFDAPLYVSTGYTYFGADYLPNVLTLRDAWKIQQDSDADFRWDYENDSMPGSETYDMKMKLRAGFTHEVTVRYSRNLESTYRQNPASAPYDTMYSPYFGTEGNGIYHYGEGIDDERTTITIGLIERFKNLHLEGQYTHDTDPTLILTTRSRDTVTRLIRGAFYTRPIDVSVTYTQTDNAILFDPVQKIFDEVANDTTVVISADYHYSYTLSDLWAFRFLGTIEYTLDADTLYENRTMPFQRFIADADVRDSDVFRHNGGLYAYYIVNSSSHFCIFYVLDVYRAQNSNNGTALDYFRYNRGIKFSTTFGIPDAYLNAFYDEDVTAFDEMTHYDQSYKRIGAMLSMTF